MLVEADVEVKFGFHITTLLKAKIANFASASEKVLK
jgi:hypothetical protein